jgi:hypothetical protein
MRPPDLAFDTPAANQITASRAERAEKQEDVQ